MVLWIKLYFPKSSYAEVPTPNITVFGDRAFRKYLRWNGVIGLGHQSDRIGGFVRRGRVRSFSLSSVRTQREGNHLQARKRVLLKAQLHWRPDVWSPELLEHKFLLFNPPSLWYFVMVA